MHLPFWFLIAALFLPRVSLIAAYVLDDLAPFNLAGFVSPALAIVFPRILVMLLIFQDRGMSPWLLLHGAALWGVYVAVGREG